MPQVKGIIKSLETGATAPAQVQASPPPVQRAASAGFGWIEPRGCPWCCSTATGNVLCRDPAWAAMREMRLAADLSRRRRARPSIRSPICLPDHDAAVSPGDKFTTLLLSPGSEVALHLPSVVSNAESAQLVVAWDESSLPIM